MEGVCLMVLNREMGKDGFFEEIWLKFFKKKISKKFFKNFKKFSNPLISSYLNFPRTEHDHQGHYICAAYDPSRDPQGITPIDSTPVVLNIRTKKPFQPLVNFSEFFSFCKLDRLNLPTKLSMKASQFHAPIVAGSQAIQMPFSAGNLPNNKACRVVLNKYIMEPN